MRIIIFALFSIGFIIFYGCQNNNQQSIVDLINLQKWDSITISALKDKIGKDTLRYNRKIRSRVDTVALYGFDEYIRGVLSFRDKEISALREQNIISDENTIYLYEYRGFTVDGLTRYFIILFEEDLSNIYDFSYKGEDSDTFSVKKVEDHDPGWYIEPGFYSNPEYHNNSFFTNFGFVTKITKDKKSGLSYEILRIEAVIPY